jgi:uncharacterized protein YdeI (YjbR/CyaY-like superfamily)
MKVRYFDSAPEFRQWLATNHATATELFVGLYKKSSGKGGLTYPEAVDEALCFGWIDGILRSVDAERFCQRFTPRKPGSNWSLTNVRHIARLTQLGKMQPAGLAAFARRDPRRVGVYSFEQEKQELPPEFVKKFQANKKAWAFWQSLPPGYRRFAIHKIVSPKQEATRLRWLDRIITESAAGLRLDDAERAARRRAASK